MLKIKQYFLFVLAGLLFTQVVLAQGTQEKIDNYNIDVYINKDSSIKVIEEIKYNFGELQRHGIYRDMPIKYKARGGNYKLRISDVAVIDELGNDYNFVQSYPGNDLRLKIGDADTYVTGQKVYRIQYTVGRAINYFNDHDELYWNAVGTGWTVPIDKVKVRVYLPMAFTSEQLQKDCYLGYYGSTTTCSQNDYLWTVDKKDMVGGMFFGGENLQIGQGLTVVVGLPKGVLIEPTWWEKYEDVIKDNGILALPVLVGLIMFCLWYARGRDPKGRETIIAQFDAPDNLTPAEVGAIIDEQADDQDVSATIIDLAIRGYLKINQPTKGKNYELIKLKEADDLNKFEKSILTGMFGSSLKVALERIGDTFKGTVLKKIVSDNIKKFATDDQGVGQKVKLFDLRDKFYQTLTIVKDEIYESVVDKGYFAKNPKRIRTKFLILGVMLIIFGIFFGFSLFNIISLVLSGIIVIIFSGRLPARTKDGVLAREHILGLKKYLTVAEKDRINFHNAPEKKPEIFEKLLPFAMVLGVEKEWAKQFEGIYKGQPEWYHDPNGLSFSAMYLTASLGSFSSQTQSIISSRLSSASSGHSGFRSGGGGHSGGGGGGGGGGSW